ncbi:MAG: hypothetical protein RLP15_06810 [Cryomorphaceae bacterium]
MKRTMAICTASVLFAFSACTSGGGKSQQENSTSTETKEAVEPMGDERAAIQSSTLVIDLIARPLGEDVHTEISFNDPGKSYVFIENYFPSVNWPITPLEIRIKEDGSGLPALQFTPIIPFDSILHNTDDSINVAAKLDVKIMLEDPSNPGTYNEIKRKDKFLKDADRSLKKQGTK